MKKLPDCKKKTRVTDKALCLLTLLYLTVSHSISCVPYPGEVKLINLPVEEFTIQRLMLLYPEENPEAIDTLINEIVSLGDFVEYLQNTYSNNLNVFKGKILDVEETHDYWEEKITIKVKEVYKTDSYLMEDVTFTYIAPRHGQGDCFYPNHSTIGQTFLGYFNDHRDELSNNIHPASAYFGPGKNLFTGSVNQFLSNESFPTFIITEEHLMDIFDAAPTTAIDKLGISNPLSFKAQPQAGSIHLTLRSDKYLRNIGIYNIAGEMIHRFTPNRTSHSITVENLNPGVYSVVAQFESKRVSRKVLVAQ